MRPDLPVSFAGLRALTRDLRGLNRSLGEPGWPLYARSFLARGAAYEQLGDRAKAEASYQRFLDMWKDADPSLQGQLQQAREGLRRLRDAPGSAKVGG